MLFAAAVRLVPCDGNSRGKAGTAVECAVLRSVGRRGRGSNDGSAIARAWAAARLVLGPARSPEGVGSADGHSPVEPGSGPTDRVASDRRLGNGGCRAARARAIVDRNRATQADGGRVDRMLRLGGCRL